MLVKVAVIWAGTVVSIKAGECAVGGTFSVPPLHVVNPRKCTKLDSAATWNSVLLVADDFATENGLGKIIGLPVVVMHCPDKR